MKFFYSLLINCLVFPLLSQAQIPVGEHSKLLVNFFSKYHLEPKELDAKFGIDVCNLLLDQLDAERVLFSSEEVTDLRSRAIHIHNEINNEKSDFLDQFKTKLNQAINRSERQLEQYLNSQIILWNSINIDSVILNKYVPEEELSSKWKMKFHLELLYSVSTKVDEFGISTTDTKAIDTLLTGTIQTFQSAYKDYFKNLKTINNELDELYLNAIAGVFDPHSNYFSKEERNSFKEELQSERELFGINYKKNNHGEIEITAITPGSSAWLSGNVHTGDIIEAVTFGDLPRQVLMGMTRFEVSKLFEKTTSKELLLELRNKRNEVVKVKLVKSKVYSDDDIIKSAVLVGERKIGYISLPDFYTSWTDTTALGCANDVAKALIKLKNENIEGLILDLRDNGGGSLKEAIDLAGIFIDYGPVMVRKDFDGEVWTMKDFNKGAIYRDPLIILINEGSASASEVVSGALQDYNRGLIVGRKSFGKATGQSILPLDPEIASGIAKVENPIWGYVKITGMGIYRINRTTNQANGVLPDIELLLPYEDAFTREKDVLHALHLDSISKITYYTPLKDLGISRLSDLSASRQRNDSDFIKLTSLYKQFDSAYKKLDHCSDLKTYLETKEEIEIILKKVKAADEAKESTFKASTPSYDDAIYAVSDYMNSYRQDFLNSTENDRELEEAFRIMVDLLNK